MATSRRKRVRFIMDVNFTSEAEKEAFCGRLSVVRDQLTPSGSQTLNNYELLLALFDLAGKHSSTALPSQRCRSSGSFLKNAGQFSLCWAAGQDECVL